MRVELEHTSGLKPPTAALLRVSGLSITFPLRDGKEVLAVDRLNLELDQGKVLAIVGESGAGKTLTSRAVIGLLPSQARVSGSIRLDGRELIGLPESDWRRIRGRDVSIVLQNSAKSLNPTMRVGDQIVEACDLDGRMERRAAESRAIHILETLGLDAARSRMKSFPHELSGGMQQRVALAIAIAANPKLLIADEPTRSLDSVSQRHALLLLRHLQREFGMAILLVSHDLRAVDDLSDDVLVMYGGRVVEQLPACSIDAAAKMRYTRALLDSAPILAGPRVHGYVNTASETPSTFDATPGCRFSPGCRHADQQCYSAPPPVTVHSERHLYSCWHPFC